MLAGWIAGGISKGILLVCRETMGGGWFLSDCGQGGDCVDSVAACKTLTRR